MRRSLSRLLLPLMFLALYAHPAAAKGSAPAARGTAAPPHFVALTPLLPAGYPGSNQTRRARTPAAATVETTAQGVTVIRGPGSHHLAH
jgi:hypothetical protein